MRLQQFPPHIRRALPHHDAASPPRRHMPPTTTAVPFRFSSAISSACDILLPPPLACLLGSTALRSCLWTLCRCCCVCDYRVVRAFCSNTARTRTIQAHSDTGIRDGLRQTRCDVTGAWTRLRALGSVSRSSRPRYLRHHCTRPACCTLCRTSPRRCTVSRDNFLRRVLAYVTTCQRTPRSCNARTAVAKR